MRRGEALEGAQHLGQVAEGFAHAHKDQVAQHGPVRTGIAQVLTRHQNLTKNFAHGHVAFQAHAARGAEGTAHGAAHLTGKALGPAAHALAGIGGDEHGFHLRAVGQTQQKLGGAVGALLHGVHRGPGDDGGGGQTFPASLGNIGHGIEAAGHFLPQPLPDLHGAEAGFTQLRGHPGFQFGQGQVEDVAHEGAYPTALRA